MEVFGIFTSLIFLSAVISLPALAIAALVKRGEQRRRVLRIATIVLAAYGGLMCVLAAVFGALMLF
ncbi:MAG: hypothetical protein ACREUY_04125, partial [Burkholderiales bacterium]